MNPRVSAVLPVSTATAQVLSTTIRQRWAIVVFVVAFLQ
jgi:hypothetical protein